MRNDHSGGPDAGSRIDGGPGTLARRWADLGARSRDQARELDPPPLAPWTLDRQRSWTLVCAAPDGGFRRLKKLFRVSSADGSSNKSARPLGGTWIPDLGSSKWRKIAGAKLMASPLERLIYDQLLVEAQRFLEHAPAAAALEPVALAPSASAEVPCSLDRTLGGMREEAATIGMELYPLTTVAEVAAVVASALLYPSGTPFRASRMRTELHIRGVHLTTDYELTRLLQRLEASGGWAELLATLRVRGEKRCTLVPPVTACVVCDGKKGFGSQRRAEGPPDAPQRLRVRRAADGRAELPRVCGPRVRDGAQHVLRQRGPAPARRHADLCTYSPHIFTRCILLIFSSDCTVPPLPPPRSNGPPTYPG